MKWTYRFIPLAVVWLAFGLTGCRPDGPPVDNDPDYRDAFVGYYNYRVHTVSNMVGSSEERDTVDGTMAVSVVTDADDQIRFAVVNEVAFVTESGSFSRAVPVYRSNFEGEFYGEDSLRIRTGWSTNAASYEAQYWAKRQQ